MIKEKVKKRLKIKVLEAVRMGHRAWRFVIQIKFKNDTTNLCESVK